MKYANVTLYLRLKHEALLRVTGVSYTGQWSAGDKHPAVTNDGPVYFTSSFCRTMLASSAAFAVMWSLSVCLSRSWIVSKKQKTYHQIFFTVR